MATARAMPAQLQLPRDISGEAGDGAGRTRAAFGHSPQTVQHITGQGVHWKPEGFTV